MKRIKILQEWCLGCRLCEYYCAYANSDIKDMVLALKDKEIKPKLVIESKGTATFALSCRHCHDAICVKSCISGAMTRENGVTRLDREKCVGCQTCVLVCPFGAVVVSEDGIIDKCELCTNNREGEPKCVRGCPNGALVLEEVEA
ncbi:MAG: 4Fe-4S binding protein [Clostridia bacterium]|nr:4Fe-4S binding protein [Clostridia bacterium]